MFRAAWCPQRLPKLQRGLGKVKGSRISHGGIKNYLELKSFEFLKSLIYLKAEPSKEFNCHKFPPQSKPNLLFSREVCITPRQTLSQTMIPPAYSPKGSFIFPKSHLLSHK